MSSFSFNDIVPFIVAGIVLFIFLVAYLSVRLYKKRAAEFMESEKRIMGCNASDIMEIQMATMEKKAKDILNELYRRAKHDLVAAAKDRSAPSFEIFLELKSKQHVAGFGDQFRNMVVDPFTDKMLAEGFTVEFFPDGHKAMNIDSPAFRISCKIPECVDPKQDGYVDGAVDA